MSSNRILWLPNSEARAEAWDDNPRGGRNPSGIRIDPDTALYSTVVLACARVLAESVASLPVHLYRITAAGGKEIARELHLYRLLHSAPNQWQTSFEWREQQVLWLALWGNSYNLIVSGKKGFATELWPLHPSRMKVEQLENGRLRYRYRDDTGREEIYSQDQIMHIRWMSDDGVNGMIPIELARDAIGLARACEVHGARYFGNGARPGLVLTSPNEITADAARELRDNWERMHRGPDRSSRTAVLSGGMEVKDIGGSNNQESQYLETRRFQIEEICRLFRVPPHLVGDLSRSSFSNIEQQSIDFVQHTLLPWCRRFETAFSRDLLTDENLFVEFDVRGLMRGDASTRAAYYSTLSGLGVVSVNEIRAWENLNPVENGDMRFVGLNMQTLDQASQQAESAKETPEKQEQPTADVGGLLAIIGQISAGAVTPEGASAIMAAVFPQMPKEVADSVISGAVKKEPPAPPQAEQPPATVISEASARAFCPTGEGGGLDNSCSGGGGGGGVAGMTKVKSLGGSTGAMLMKDANGNKFVVKEGNSPEHVRSEAATNDIYKAAGVAVPDHYLDESDPDAPKQVTKFIDGEPLSQVDGDLRDRAIADIQKGFAVDALVANWDVIGMEQDNILVTPDGKAYRADNGGSLRFRAQGAGKNFGPEVKELTSLRESEQGEPIFGSLSDQDVADQIGGIVAKKDRILSATPDDLREVMSQRIEYMKNWAGNVGAEGRAFCPTGEGGGVDNSCGSSGGDGGSGSSGGGTTGSSTGTARDADAPRKKIAVRDGEIEEVDRRDIDKEGYLDEVESAASENGLAVDFDTLKDLQSASDVDFESNGAALAYVGSGYGMFTGQTFGDDDVIDSYGSEYGAISDDYAAELISEKEAELEDEWNNLDHAAEFADNWDELDEDAKQEHKDDWLINRQEEINQEVTDMQMQAREEAARNMVRELESNTASSTLDCCAQLYRGLNISDSALESMIASGEVSHSGVNSWTSSRKIADNFSDTTMPGRKEVILILRNPTVGAVNTVDSLDEKEVVRPPSSLRITSVVRTNDSTFLYLDEDEDYKN